MDLLAGVAAGPSSPASPLRAKPTTGDNKVSCTACRTVKCKCVASTDPSWTRCQRCTRLDISCVYQAHQRGRRRKDASNPQPNGKQSQAVAGPGDGPAKSNSSNESRAAGPLQPPKRKRSRLDLDVPRQVSFAAGETSRAPSHDIDRPPANSVYDDVADRTIFSIAGVMDKKSRSGQDAQASPASGTADDPISLGIVTMDECDSLFGHYFDQLQTCVCLLDPAIHTASYTRSVSLPLFTSVLAVTCKFFRPDIYEILLAASNRLVDRAISDCVCAIEAVQAICILHYWKKPPDGRGWLRLGHAIRLGYQLDLHLPRRRPLSTDEREARLTLDRERTWISLFCFDSTMTQLSDRPSMMHKPPDVEAWLRSIPYPLPSDGQLEFAVKTSLLSSEVRQLQSCKGSFEVVRSGLRRVSEELHRSHLALTGDDAVVKLTSTSLSINKFSTLALQLLIECTSLSLAPHAHRISLLHACVSTSLQLLDTVVDGFARKGIMPVIEDAHSVAVASTAVRLLRFMSYLDSSAKASVRRKLTRVVIVCREAARGDQESHPAYLARFIHSLLDRAHQSRQPSRESSPVPAIPGVSPLNGPSNGLSHSPLQQKTTPDQWWDEIGQFAYQGPQQPSKEQHDFWHGFPMLAGAMDTLEPFVPGRMASGDTTGHSMDPHEQSTMPGLPSLPWDAEWDLSFLGFAQDSMGNGL